MMKFQYTLIATLAVAMSAHALIPATDYSFKQYILDFHKHYEKHELNAREQLFRQRLAGVLEHNRQPHHTWKKGINKFSDHHPHELKSYLGYDKVHGMSVREGLIQTAAMGSHPLPSSGQLPESVDWRGSNIVTPVKDQGRCGSCWTFASAETIESHFAMQTGHLQVLSEQQILDCTPNPKDCGGTGGCGGGTAELAMGKIVEMGGLASEWRYPYNSYFGTDFKCKFNASRTVPVAKLSGFMQIPSNKAPPLMDAVANKGPISITVAAGAWFEYESGVFNGCNQTNPDLDHLTQLVGYGTDPAHGDYWLVRNSWSPEWGENGYIRLHRPATPTCGVDLTPGDGSGCTGGPSKVTVCGTCGILYDNVYPVMA